MSEINLGFVVEPNNINIVADNNNINFTPSDIQLSVYTGSAPVPGGNNTQLQYNNNGLLGGISNVTYNGSKLSLGNVANVLMTGGTNGYVLQTDGTGNLSWTAQSGNGGGNGTPGGANTQIQYNDAGSFGGNAGFTFNEVSGNVNLPNDLIVAGTIYGTFSGNSTNANYANFAGTAFNVSGSNVSGEVANAAYANAANTSNLATYATTANSVAGANVSGTVANATFALDAGNSNLANTANSVAVANVSGIGNIATINLDGSSSNVLYGNGIFSAIDTSVIANGNSSVRISNVNGPVEIFSNSTVTPVATFLSNGVGSMSVNNTISTNVYVVNSGGRITYNDGIVRLQTGSSAVGANYQIMIGANNPGNADFAIAIGNNTSTVGANSIAIGTSSTANLESVTIGAGAGRTNHRRAVTLGASAGSGSNVAGNWLNSIAIGYTAGVFQQDNDIIAIGGQAGNGQNGGAIAIGGGSGQVQALGAVTIGYASGGNQGLKSIAIGQSAGQNNQGNFSIAIGTSAGYSNQHSNTTILNSTGTALNSTQADSLFVKPIRDVTGNVDFTVTLKYNPTTGEIGYV